jgi:hypothetical protein
MSDYVEGKIKQVEEEVYSGAMPAHNKSVLRKELENEEEFWERWDARVDSNTGHDDQ